jgi:hypothetical protein
VRVCQGIVIDLHNSCRSVGVRREELNEARIAAFMPIGFSREIKRSSGFAGTPEARSSWPRRLAALAFYAPALAALDNAGALNIAPALPKYRRYER